jgi:cell division protein FtsQ
VSTVTVDPRLRARRATVARDAGRRRLRRLLALAALLGVVAFAFAATFTPALDIEDVAVRGDGRTSVEAITEAAEVTAGDALVWFDTGEAERAVAALPWVQDATVERTWTGEVTIAVTERRAAATLGAGDGTWLLVDGTGRVLDRVDAQPTDVPLIEGVEADAGPGETLQGPGADVVAVAGAVPEALRPQVATVRGADDRISVTLRDGGTVALGGPDDAAAKLASAAAVLATVPAGCVQELDVSVASSPALVRSPACG